MSWESLQVPVGNLSGLWKLKADSDDILGHMPPKIFFKLKLGNKTLRFSLFITSQEDQLVLFGFVNMLPVKFKKALNE